MKIVIFASPPSPAEMPFIFSRRQSGRQCFIKYSAAMRKDPGYYGVVIGDAANIARGSIFPRERNGVYGDYIREQVLPVIAGAEEERAATAEALSLESIEKKLTENEPYTVDVACEIGGEIYNKRFMFYTVDREKHFYIFQLIPSCSP